MDPIDAISEMQSRHEKGELWVGLDSLEGEISDMTELDVYEPLQVKAQAIKSATKAATMLLKIDDVIAASKMKPPKMPPGGPEGAGGMPGGMPPHVTRDYTKFSDPVLYNFLSHPLNLVRVRE